MGVREYDYIRGNTALKPERKIQERDRSKEQERRNKERKKREREAYIKRKQIIVGVSSVIGLTLILSTVTLFMNGYVYKLQNNLSTIEEEVREEQDVNEALKVEMLKFASIARVKDTAENELDMVYPTEESTITIDMSKEYFSHIKKDEKNKSNLLAKLMSIFN